jgi:hypothetical protein
VCCDAKIFSNLAVGQVQQMVYLVHNDEPVQECDASKAEQSLAAGDKTIITKRSVQL